MNKYIVLVLISVFWSSLSKAQKKNKTEKVYTYQMLKNDPEDVKNLWIGLTPIQLNVNDDNFNAGVGADIGYLIKNRLRIDMQVYQSYFDNGMQAEIDDEPMSPFSKHEQLKSYSNEVGLTYYFKKKLKDVNEVIHLKNEGNVSYVTKIPSKDQRLIGLRLGYGGAGTIVPEGVISYSGFQVDDPTVKKEIGDEFGNTLTYSMVPVGVSYTKITDVSVFIEQLKNKSDDGERHVKWVTEWYGDVLYATNITLDNVMFPLNYDSNEQYFYNFKEFNVNDDVEKSKMGFRVGYRTKGIKGFNGNYGFEAGMRPGVGDGSHRTYLLIKFGANISFKAG